MMDFAAVIQPNSVPDANKSSKRRACLDPGDVRFEDCQLYIGYIACGGINLLFLNPFRGEPLVRGRTRPK
jgi:hypothetical protein